MIAALLLDEGSMIVFMVLLLRLGILMASTGTLFMTLNRKSLALRVVGLAVAVTLAFVGYGLLQEKRPGIPFDPTGRYVVAGLCVPVLVGLGTVLFFPRPRP